MPIIENTPRRMVLRSGSNTLILDKDAGAGVLHRKMLFWKLKPHELPLSDFTDVKVDTVVDPASGAEICHAMLVSRAGGGWALAARDKADAESTKAALRGFLGLA